MDTQYKTEIFRPNPYSILRDNYYPLAEKMLSLDSYLKSYNSVTSHNEAAIKARTLSYHERGTLGTRMNRLKHLDYYCDLSDWSKYQLQREIDEISRILILSHSWLGSDFMEKHTGFKLKSLDQDSRQHLQTLIWNSVLVPCLNGQCEEWLKEVIPKYKSIGYQFRTFVCTNARLTDKQLEQQKPLCLPVWETKYDNFFRFLACFEPIPK